MTPQVAELTARSPVCGRMVAACARLPGCACVTAKLTLFGNGLAVAGLGLAIGLFGVLGTGFTSAPLPPSSRLVSGANVS